jgi:hypothetical protein
MRSQSDAGNKLLHLHRVSILNTYRDVPLCPTCDSSTRAAGRSLVSAMLLLLLLLLLLLRKAYLQSCTTAGSAGLAGGEVFRHAGATGSRHAGATIGHAGSFNLLLLRDCCCCCGQAIRYTVQCRLLSKPRLASLKEVIASHTVPCVQPQYQM